MSNDFDMIKTVIACRLNTAVNEILTKINEYNQKINELRAPVIKRIQTHYAERHNLSFVHVLTGSKLRNDSISLSVQYLNDDYIRIQANGREFDDLQNMSYNLHIDLPMHEEFKQELKSLKHFIQEPFDVDSMATLAAAEIVLKGVPQCEIMKTIDAAVVALIPNVEIPKVEEHKAMLPDSMKEIAKGLYISELSTSDMLKNKQGV